MPLARRSVRCRGRSDGVGGGRPWGHDTGQSPVHRNKVQGPLVKPAVDVTGARTRRTINVVMRQADISRRILAPHHAIVADPEEFRNVPRPTPGKEHPILIAGRRPGSPDRAIAWQSADLWPRMMNGPGLLS